MILEMSDRIKTTTVSLLMVIFVCDELHFFSRLVNVIEMSKTYIYAETDSLNSTERRYQNRLCIEQQYQQHQQRQQTYPAKLRECKPSGSS